MWCTYLIYFFVIPQKVYASPNRRRLVDLMVLTLVLIGDGFSLKWLWVAWSEWVKIILTKAKEKEYCRKKTSNLQFLA